jgi:hypothetical protein
MYMFRVGDKLINLSAITYIEPHPQFLRVYFTGSPTLELKGAEADAVLAELSPPADELPAEDTE